MKEIKRTKAEIFRAQDTVRRHDAAIIYSKAVKPSAHALEDEGFEKIYKEALKRLARREKNELR